ncbi:MAG: hypothetical protein JXB88_15130 [Spirochaetales bacterium]|nr:hypothetical protein [Spirochaetales bacterium]
MIDITLKPGETILLNNSYEYKFEEYIKEYNDWEVIEPPENQIDYVLKTGALWAGPIGKLEIAISFENIPHEIFGFSERLLKGFQSGISETNSVFLTFRKNNFEPENDVQIFYYAKNASDVLFTYARNKKYGRLEYLIDTLNRFEKKYKDWDWGPWEFNPNRFQLQAVVDSEILRYVLYWTANELFRKNLAKAISYYLQAFTLVEGNQYPADPDVLITKDISDWKSSDKAPGYYIAYNLACAYSLLEDIDKAGKWLRIAIRLNSKVVKKFLSTDKDLENLRRNKALFKDIITTEPRTIISLQNKTLNSLKTVFNDFTDKFTIDYNAPITKDKVEIVYLPEDYAPYAIFVYYEALHDSKIKVDFIQYGMVGKFLGKGEEIIASGKGLLFLQIKPTGENPELPIHWADDLYESSNSYGFFIALYKKTDKGDYEYKYSAQYSERDYIRNNR